MPNFTPRPDRSLVRALTTADEQLAGIFNQSWQAIADNSQLIINNLAGLEQQATAIEQIIASIETSFSTQQNQLATAQSAANPVLAASLQRNSEANSLATANSAANNKVATASTNLTAAETNLNSIALNAQPYSPLLQSIAGLSRPNNSMLGTNGAGAVGWFVASGQSFTIEMAYFALRTPANSNSGAIASGSGQQLPIATAGYSNCRNQFGLIETALDGNTIVLPCTGGNCRYYMFGWATFSGVVSANTRIRGDGATLSNGTTVQAIAGRSAIGENFNQTSTIFAPLNVSSEARVIIEGWVQNPNSQIPTAALGFGSAGGNSDAAGVLLLRRRIL
jgi:hypothetical protein